MERLILAPMEGLTDRSFRNIYFSLFAGLPEAFSPFVSVAPGVNMSKLALADLLPGPPENYRLVPQILGREPQSMLDADKWIHSLGYDEVNVNLGCPSSTVTRKGKGAALLSEPEVLAGLLRPLAESCRCRLSVKVRLGMNQANEILALTELFNSLPLCEVTLHPRTGVQQYNGVGDLQAFARAAREIRHPLVYNGDIRFPSHLKALKRLFPQVAGWMIGRGLLMDPFLGEEISGLMPGPSIPADRISRIRLFLDLFYENYIDRRGKGGALGRTKSIALMMMRSFQGGQSILKKIARSGSYENLSAILDSFLGQKPLWIPALPPRKGDEIPLEETEADLSEQFPGMKPLPELIALAAIDENGCIGSSGSIPWRAAEDLRHFRETTRGGVVIMGRSTFDSLPAPLEDRITIVLSRSSASRIAGPRGTRGPDGLNTLTWNRGSGPWLCSTLQEAAALTLALGHERAWVCGGGMVYQQALPSCAGLMITAIQGTHQGDTFFPNISAEDWGLLETREIGPGQRVMVLRARCLMGAEALNQGSADLPDWCVNVLNRLWTGPKP